MSRVAEMSQITMSPPPVALHRTPSTGFANLSQSTTASNDAFFERRRSSHPHNRPARSHFAGGNNMASQSQSESNSQSQSQSHLLPRPRLEHQASQTVIDLTSEDADNLPSAAPQMNGRPFHRPPPQLGRSDAEQLDIIDLTEDDGDIQIVGARHRGLTLPQPPPSVPRTHFPPLPRFPPPSLFVPQENNAPISRSRRLIDGAFTRFGALSGLGVTFGGDGRTQIGVIRDQDLDEGVAHVLQIMQTQTMPGRMDYRYPAMLSRTPEYEAPEPARPGFTRSPTEDQLIICPSCEKELVHNTEMEEPPLKKNGKAPTKKEREEHPYWVLRDCGHVYCNHCFQNRCRPIGKVSFPEKPGCGRSKNKVYLCAVDECQTEVREKAKWIGIFL